ncbi:MAG: hypothetical protein V1899_02000, partial [Planctomycetota bacterium]
MKYDASIHHRRAIRLKGYDYAQSGAYFVTVCAQHRECLFGDMVDGAMVLNDTGRMVEKCWYDIPAHFPNVELDEFVVMPNHVHGILFITDPVGANNHSPLQMPDHPVGANNHSPLQMPDHSVGANNHSPLQMPDHSVGANNHSPLQMPDHSVGANNHSPTQRPDHAVGANNHSPLQMPDHSVGAN